MTADEKPARATVLTREDAMQLLCTRNHLVLGHIGAAVCELEAFADPAMTKINSWGWIEAIAGGTAADFAPAVKRSAPVDTLGDFTEPSELDIEHQLQAPSVPVELARAMEGPRASPSQQEVAAPVGDAQLQALWDEACKDSPTAPGWCRHLRFGRAVLAASRAPVAVGVSDEQIAEIAERLELSDAHCTLWRNFATHILNVAALNVATQPAGAGGSVGASREQDSFHVANAESSRAQGAEPVAFAEIIQTAKTHGAYIGTPVNSGTTVTLIVPEFIAYTREMIARHSLATPAPSVEAVELPPMYLCPNGCGCAWRDNLNGTMSLYDGNQKACGVCETLPLKDLVPVPAAPGNIENHLYVDQRHDGMWLVCVESQYSTRPEAQAACRSWARHYAAPSVVQPTPGQDAEPDSVHLGSGAGGGVHAPGPTTEGGAA